jgi:hypothetical protein
MEFWGWMKKVKVNLFRKSKKDITPKRYAYYEGIDELPLHNWIKCLANDLKCLRKDENGTDEQDKEAWVKIYDSYIAEFGIGEMYKKMLKAMQKKALLEVDYILTRDRFKLTEIEMQIANLDAMIGNRGYGMTIEQSLVHLSKWMGSWINPKMITTREYFNLMDEYGKENKRK